MWVDLKHTGTGGQLVMAAQRRQSTKDVSAQPLMLSQFADLLWFGAGEKNGRRPYASAHALYPVTLSVAVGAVEGLSTAMYRYYPARHSLEAVAAGDHRGLLAGMTIDADWIATCPVVLVFTADLTHVEDHFADQGPGRGTGFAWLETGLLSQNFYLWGAAHGLGTCFIGGLRAPGDSRLSERLVPAGHRVLGVQPVGTSSPSH